MSEKTKEIALALTTLIVNGLIILNMILQAMGKPSVQIGQEDISMTINAILLVISTLYTWWRNNNITDAAIAGQEVINAYKAGDDIEVIVEDEDGEKIKWV